MKNRHSIHLEGYDYSLPAAYFVTMVSHKRVNLFGDIISGRVLLSKYGLLVEKICLWLPQHYPYVQLEPYVVMPNHVHAILQIMESEDSRGGSRPAPTYIKPLGQIIGAFKTVSAKSINQIRNTPGNHVWQRGFYERIIRNEKQLSDIWNYIEANPNSWLEDRINLKISNT